LVERKHLSYRMSREEAGKIESFLLARREYSRTAYKRASFRKYYILWMLCTRLALRSGCALKTRADDIDMTRHTLRIRAENSKNGMEGSIYIPEKDDLRKNLYKYILEEKERFEDGYIFWRAKKTSKNKHFNKTSWGIVLINVSKELGLCKTHFISKDGKVWHNIHPHSCRTYFVCEKLEEGYSLRDVAKVTLHRSVECLSKYYDMVESSEVQRRVLEGFTKATAQET
jgi:hypothetical protein